MILLVLIGSYFLGNVLTGPIISKLFYKQEIRDKGSGNPGARNIGRLYGKKAFVITFIGDAMKGMLVIFTAQSLDLGSEIELFTLFAVTLGHVYPILFKFRGGKGISTFIGGLLLFNPLVVAVFISIFLIVYPFIKSFTIAGVGAVSSLPVILLLFSYEQFTLLAACLLSGLVLLAHRENLKEKTCRRKGRDS
ncbi:glycerol-3-phosphate acyltransferase [Sporosarcina sp. G11-34]|uniref:glycerol-3-phosphate acyltransferase n=1 Tax=Sporosarcina sp. G11-34 TaxID=2849605 RepID=UPI0022A8FBED|nr:glycerol-3-phosphate acyltransferase [Sporosarcina sp. G11-34]MCZ2259122.1 glycerol-3-phosphate acyltransferase [Sporosarcina sp. G11-34]